MKKLYCNGKKDYCDRGNDDTVDCKDCEFADGTGGDIVDVPDTVYQKIKAMSIDEMAEAIYSSDIERCHFCKNKFCTIIKDNCVEGIKKWLESEAE